MKIGDLVKLKSGGPVMTVSSEMFAKPYQPCQVEVTWYDGFCFFRKEKFAVDALKIEESK